MTDLKERGVEDMFIVCVDGLTGFPEAIRAAFPRTMVQLRIMHLVRETLKYVPDTDSREVASDLKTIYQSATVVLGPGTAERLRAVGVKSPYDDFFNEAIEVTGVVVYLDNTPGRPAIEVTEPRQVRKVAPH